VSFVIYKYPLQVNDTVAVSLPQDAELLCVQEQHGKPCLWALVDPTADTVQRVLRMAGTGHPLSDDEQRTYLNTFQLLGGELVFHVFEVVPASSEGS
jgi:hypothetical protein